MTDADKTRIEKAPCPYESWVNEYFGLPKNFPEKAMTTDFDYGQIVNLLAMFDAKRNEFHKTNLDNVMHERDIELAAYKERLKQERNNVIDECIEYFGEHYRKEEKWTTIEIQKELEWLKSKPE